MAGAVRSIPIYRMQSFDGFVCHKVDYLLSQYIIDVESDKIVERNVVSYFYGRIERIWIIS